MSSQTKTKGDVEDWFYSPIVKDHFFKPRNILKTEAEEKKIATQASGVGQVGSPACGDIMKMWIVVANNRIVACKWKTFGCASAIASTSILSEMVTKNGGMTLTQALKITPADIVKNLKGLPDRKVHCSVLGDQALTAAIKDYQAKI